MATREAREGDYLSVVEFADKLHVDEMTVRHLIAKGVIAAIDVGTSKRPRLRIPPSQFAALEQARAIR